jgi:outer membrane protein assembly factor BamB
VVGAAAANDWPQWRGVNRDAKAVFTTPKAWPKTLTQKWKLTVGDGVATPSLVGDRLYIFTRQGGSEIIRCVDAATGKKEFWQDKLEVRGADGAAAGFAGPRCSPTVADGKVITLGVRGTLSCYDAASGKRLWRKDDYKSWPMFYTSSSPIVVDGLCIAQLGSQKDGAVVAYELNTGNQKWKWTADGTAYASPTLLTIDGIKAVVAETQGSVVALNVVDGKVLWKTGFAITGMRSYNASTPTIEGQVIYYGGSGRGTKAVRIEKKGAELAGKEIWSNSDNSVIYNTPVIKNGMVFALSDRDSLFCINAESGKTTWTSMLTSRGRYRGYGSIVDAGSVLFALNPSGTLVAFEPNGKEFKQVASYKVSESETFAYPVISGNRVFVKDSESVILYAFE